MKRVGILAGRERNFPNSLIQWVARRDAGVVAEWARLGGTALDEPCPYQVIVDRISHEVPYYEVYLKHAHAQGVHVINNPFKRQVEDKFNANYMAAQLGVAVPKTVVLPNKEYIPDITGDSLSNLRYPLPWQEIAAYIGLPAILKPAMGGGWKAVTVAYSVEEMIQAFDQSGQLTMLVQEFIKWDRYVRCICIGREKVLPIAWDPTRPHHERYLNVPDYLAPELATRVEREALALCQGLGYDMNTVEFAIRDEVPYAIDFTNSAPDFDVASLGEWHANWVLESMTDLVIRLAHQEPHGGDPGVGGSA